MGEGILEWGSWLVNDLELKVQIRKDQDFGVRNLVAHEDLEELEVTMPSFWCTECCSVLVISDRDQSVNAACVLSLRQRLIRYRRECQEARMQLTIPQHPKVETERVNRTTVPNRNAKMWSSECINKDLHNERKKLIEYVNATRLLVRRWRDNGCPDNLAYKT